MFIIANFLVAIAKISDIILSIMMWAVIIRALLSWVNPDPYNAIVQLLNKVTEPLLTPIRRFIPMFNLGIDLSPIIAILIIIFMQTFVVRSLYQIANTLQ